LSALGSKGIVSVNAVDYASVGKVVCGKKTTVNDDAAIPVRSGEIRRNEDNILKIMSLLYVRQNLSGAGG
jgi:hypothetical protein